ncbi:hypothetical protein Vretimale_19886 [Volvox reticuliferus]|uniref:Uncharacterized protein n=1 Tax=Volvox reticuliferus TaxID=1737510 RepID=A0A8J4D0R1_9CHLO|nr:hypothetical protein Vretifemale_20885 [Volvox reticuliferus]GIM17349.1 hypothetical protein Vretimale_19886 [Volvox reticuliferus]
MKHSLHEHTLDTDIQIDGRERRLLFPPSAAVLLVSGGGSSSSSSRGGVGSAVVRPEELRGIISSLEQSAVALVSYCHGFTACAGPSLKQSLKQLCTAVIKPTQELVEQLLRNGGTEGPRKAFALPASSLRTQVLFGGVATSWFAALWTTRPVSSGNWRTSCKQSKGRRKSWTSCARPPARSWE